jgi:hypothetical protein
VIDGVLGVLGVLIGAVSLTYPFGRDQGLYYYVAREWVAHGSIVYRDVLDHKTPGIYVLHALAIVLFGEHTWGIRVADLVCVVAAGLLAGALTAPRGASPLPGARGIGVLAASILYYGYFDFWNTAQSELWYATLGVASVWAALRLERDRFAQAAAGCLGAVAMIMKPPAVWFVLIAVAIIAWRGASGGSGERRARWRAAAIAVAVFSGAFAVPVLVTLAFFAAKHALGAAYEVVVLANGYYVSHEAGVSSLLDVASSTGDMALHYRPFSFLLPIALAGCILSNVRPTDRAALRRLGLAVLLCAAAYAAVGMQKKFYLLHFGVFIVPVTVLVANIATDFCVAIRQRFGKASWAAPAFAFTFTFLFAFADHARLYAAENLNAYRYLNGSISREEFTRLFQMRVLGFDYHDSELAGLWVRDHSSPDDFIAVRGFEPQIYAVAGRRYPGRFFWTTFIVNPRRERESKRAEWLEEDRRALQEHPPRLIVVYGEVHEGPDSAEWFEKDGYHPKATFGYLTILGRDEPGDPPPTAR